MKVKSKLREEEEAAQVEGSEETPDETIEESAMPQSMKEKIAKANKLLGQIRSLKEEVEQEEAALEKEMQEMEAEDEMVENWFNEEEEMNSEEDEMSEEEEGSAADEEEDAAEDLEEEWAVNAKTGDQNGSKEKSMMAERAKKIAAQKAKVTKK